MKNNSIKDIRLAYRVTEEEYPQLHEKYSRLCWKAAHELKRKNSRNNFTDDAEDIYQELVEAMLVAGSYYKRQVYIEKSLAAAKEHAKDGFLSWVVLELEQLWNNRTRHGANRQKFGKFQEQLLERLVNKFVPTEQQPNRNAPLKIDSKFGTYCKSIVWNRQKNMGKRITREKAIRNSLVSISEHGHLLGETF
jgi:hypothetical protein